MQEPTPTVQWRDDCDFDGSARTQRLHSPKSQQQRFTSTCHFHLSPETVVDFKLVPKLIGKKGRNVKHIWEASGCKLRIRGYGSGHLEGPTMQEAKVALQMVLSAESMQSLDKARAMVAELLRDVSGRFAQYCKKAGVFKPTRLYTIVDGRN